jgi:hypothetical protein
VQAELQSPDGTVVRVLDDDGISGTQFEHYDVLLNDAAPVGLHDAAGDDDPANPYYERLTRPFEPLRAFQGEGSAGTWTLRVRDLDPASNDGSYLRSRLILTPRGMHPKSGRWTYRAPGTDELDYVVQTVTIYGEDVVGNRTTDPASLMIWVDSIPPEITVDEAITETATGGTEIVLRGTVMDGGPATYVSAHILTPAGERYRQGAGRDGDQWWVDLDARYLGSYILSLVASDQAGNSAMAGPFVVATRVQEEPPTADPNGPYSGDEGSPIPLDGTGSSDPNGDPLIYAWTVDDPSLCAFDDSTSATPSLTCTDDGDFTVTLEVNDAHCPADSDTAAVTVDNVAPTATLNSPTYVIAGNDFELSLTEPYDPSSADTDAGFGYAFDCDDGDGYGSWSSTNTATCSTSPDEVGDRTVKGKIRDKDGGETEYTATVTILPPSAATDSALCYYDREPEIPGQQFRLVFTPDMQEWPAHKLPASNPGQFFYNVFYTGAGPASFRVSVPEPFETQGATPVHVYTGVSVVEMNSHKCFVPDPDSEIYAGDLSGLSGLSDPGGFLYVTVHLDYGLKGTTGYIPNPDDDALDADDETVVLIPNLSDHIFSVSGSQNDSQTIQNANDFKKIPGFGGLVTDGTNPVAGATVEITLDGELLGEATTDDDGWYMYEYKHKGKPAKYTVELLGYGLSETGTLKANKFAEVNFVVN